MGKHNSTRNRTDTKVLFKKSNIACRTHSRSCSDASQITKSGILHIKKNLSKTTDYYTDGDKVKRDLSVETGVCVLRRYYKSKHKRDKCSIHTSSAKSKCSIAADTEFAESKPDHACGDSRNKFDIINPANPLNIDITSLMVENLKGLLNDWIRKYVLEDTETKKKLVNVLDSLLQSLETKIISTTHSSCSTYVVERNGANYRVRNKKTETNSLTCQYCKQKQTSIITNTSSSVLFKKYSRFTIPFPYKHLRIISTLSIPRNMYKRDKSRKKNFVYKVKKVQRKSIVSKDVKKDRKVVINVSSCAISNESKRRPTKPSRRHYKKSQIKKRGILFLPQMFYRSTTDCTSTVEIDDEMKNEETQESQLDAMPSLVKSIYADDPANVTSTDKLRNYENRNDICTMTETGITHHNFKNLIASVSNVQFHDAKYVCSNKTVETSSIVNEKYENADIDFINQSIEFPNMTTRKQNLLDKQYKKKHKVIKFKSQKKRNKLSRKRKSIFHKIKSKSNKYKSIKYKKFTYLYRKRKNRNIQGDFFTHLRNIFKYFAEYEGKRDIKLEIHCNVYPFLDVKQKLFHRDIKASPKEASNVALAGSAFDLKAKDEKIGLKEKPTINPGIIPLLDGAASQAKYIFKSDNSTKTSDNSIKYRDSTEKGTIMTGLEVSKELSELKTAIKDLSTTAEMILQEHIIRQKVKSKHDSSIIPNKSIEVKKTNTFENSEKQVMRLSNTSKGIQISNNVAKGQLLSGIKLSKGPKIIEEFTNRLKKRSSSYHVIDSESILRVTDMTASVNKSKDSNKPCALQKSKSLLQITDEVNKKKLIEFVTNKDQDVKNFNMVYRMCPGKMSSHTCKPQTNHYNDPCCKTVNMSDCQGFAHDCCSSVCVDIDKPTITVKKKSGLPFWEGCLYCILLWIPLIIIVFLFYDYVLKDAFKSNSTTPKPPRRRPKLRMALPSSDFMNTENKTSQFLLKLSDFGF